MQNQKDSKVFGFLVAVLLAVLIGGGIYAVRQKSAVPRVAPAPTNKNTSEVNHSKTTESTPPKAPPSTPVPSSSLYWDTTRGFEFGYPKGFSPSGKGGVGNGFVVSLYEDSGGPVDGGRQSAINIFAVSAKDATSFSDYHFKYPITNADNGVPYKFTPRILGSNTFYYTRTERFEGTLSFTYYIVHAGTLYRFVSSSEGVAWSDPKLDEENDPIHVALREMLATFKFTQ